MKRLLDHFADWMERRGRARWSYRRVRGSRDRYLRRVYLIRTRLFGVYLHQFWLSDEEGLHDHPWSFVSIVLAGGYTERFLRGTRWRSPGSVTFCPATWFHRIEVPASKDPYSPAYQPPGATWTLFFRGPRVRRWGFLPISAWVAYKPYRGGLE